MNPDTNYGLTLTLFFLPPSSQDVFTAHRDELSVAELVNLCLRNKAGLGLLHERGRKKKGGGGRRCLDWRRGLSARAHAHPHTLEHAHTLLQC